MDRVYFNDEWNEPISLTNEKLMNYQIFYRECYRLLEERIKENFIKIGTSGQTLLPKGLETLEKFEEYKNNLKINNK